MKLKSLLLLVFLALAIPVLGRGPSVVTPNNPSGVTSASPQFALYIASACQPSNSCFFTPANTRQDYTASWTNASTTVTVTDNFFSTCPTGQQIMGWNATMDQAFTSAANPGGAITQTTAVTIVNCADANHATLSATPANTSTANAVITVGNPDDVGSTALDAAVAASTTCPQIYYAATFYSHAAPHHFTNPASCSKLSVSHGSAVGLVYQAAGLLWSARGRGNTIIFIWPNFTGFTNGISGKAAYFQPVEGEIHDIQFNCSGNMAMPNMPAGNGAAALLEVNGPGLLEHVMTVNCGGNQASVVGTGSYGLYVDQGWEVLRDVDISGTGATGLAIASGAGVGGRNVAIENEEAIQALLLGPGPSISQGGIFQPTLTCDYCRFFEGQAQPATALTNQFLVEITGGAQLYMTNSNIATNSSSSNLLSAGIYFPASSGAAGTAYLERVVIGMNNPTGGSSTANRAISCQFANSIITLKDSTLSTQASGYLIEDTAGCIIKDQGNNFYGGPAYTLAGLGFNFTAGNATTFSAEHTNFIKVACTGSLTASVTNTFGVPTSTRAACGTPTPQGTIVQGGNTGTRTVTALVCAVKTAGTTATTCTLMADNVATTSTCTIAASGTICTDAAHHPTLTDGQVMTVTMPAGAATTPSGAQAVAQWN